MIKSHVVHGKNVTRYLLYQVSHGYHGHLSRGKLRVFYSDDLVLKISRLLFSEEFMGIYSTNSCNLNPWTTQD